MATITFFAVASAVGSGTAQELPWFVGEDGCGGIGDRRDAGGEVHLHGIALTHLDGFPELATRLNASRTRPRFPLRDRGERWRILNRSGVIQLDGPAPEDVRREYERSERIVRAFLDPVMCAAWRPNDEWFDNRPSGLSG